MKRKILDIIVLFIALFLFHILDYIFQFAAFLIQIDNTEFGFPWWLDISIDFVAGIAAAFFQKRYSVCRKKTLKRCIRFCLLSSDLS